MIAPRFDGKVALITGVGRAGQVGEAVASAFATLGATLILVDRDAANVTERMQALRATGASATAHTCDLTDPKALERMVAIIEPTAPLGVHALVCLAGGFAASGPLAESDPEVWHRQIGSNLTSAAFTTRALLPLVRKARGAIVYFASASALPGAKTAKIAAYAAAKTGVVALMQSVAQEEKATGVRANALAPTSIRTAENLATMGDDVSYVERETVADWVTLLCSDVATGMSGQVLKLG